MSATTAPSQHCDSMAEVRRHIDALDARIVPLLAERGAYVAQAARIKQRASQVRDEARIEDIVQRVRGAALKDGGDSEVIEQIYRSMMEACIAFEEREFARLREVTAQGERA